tara:strand:+ start:4574 stop:4987 length:414 start_codon:yes stop_codon:yes gene_type:complete
LGALSSRSAPATANNAPPFALGRSTPDAFFFAYCYCIFEARLRYRTVIANLLRYLGVVIFVIWKKNRSINPATRCYLLPSLRTWCEWERTLMDAADRGAMIQMQDCGVDWFADTHLNQDSVPSVLGLSTLIKRSVIC